MIRSAKMHLHAKTRVRHKVEQQSAYSRCVLTGYGCTLRRTLLVGLVSTVLLLRLRPCVWRGSSQQKCVPISGTGPPPDPMAIPHYLSLFLFFVKNQPNRTDGCLQGRLGVENRGSVTHRCGDGAGDRHRRPRRSHRAANVLGAPFGGGAP